MILEYKVNEMHVQAAWLKTLYLNYYLDGGDFNRFGRGVLVECWADRCLGCCVVRCVGRCTGRRGFLCAAAVGLIGAGLGSIQTHCPKVNVWAISVCDHRL